MAEGAQWPQTLRQGAWLHTLPHTCHKSTLIYKQLQRSSSLEAEEKSKKAARKVQNRAEVVFCRLQAGLWLEASQQSFNEASPAEVAPAGFDDKSTTELESNAGQTLQAAYTRWGHSAFPYALTIFLHLNCLLWEFLPVVACN